MRATDRGEEGFTLVELLITLLLMTIASVIILNFMINTTAVTARTDANVQAESDVQLAMRVLSQDIRAANPILGSCGTGYASCLRIRVPRPTAAAPNCISTIKYELAAGKVRQDRADAGCTTNRSWTARPVLEVSNATVSPALSLFSYTDRLNRVISPTQTCSADPAQPPCVVQAKTVKISLAVAYKGQVGGPLRFQSSVALRNNR